MVPITRTVTYGKNAISFDVQFRSRTTLDIAVEPDRSVVVKVPEKADLNIVDRRVKAKARWILKQQQFFEQFILRTPPRQYVSGETHLYLGRQYRLKIHNADHSRVKLLGGYIHIHTPKPKDTEIVKQLLDDWYLDHAKAKFQERLDQCFKSFDHLGQPQPNLKIRTLQKRWGSLTPTGNLLLNRDLIRAPRQCIDYVVIHELCHLKYPDHSPQFYKFISLILPDWEKKKLKLEKSLI